MNSVGFFPLQRGIAAQSQLLSGFALTALCPLLPAAVCDPVSVGPSAARLCGAGCTIRCPQNEMCCFITCSQWQLSPRNPHTCKGRYMSLPMPHWEEVCISDGQESHLSENHHLTALQSLKRKPEVCAQVGPVQGVMETCQQCTLFTHFN